MRRRPLLRFVAVLALLFAAFAVYRVFFVYTVRSGDCSASTLPPRTALLSGSGWIEGRELVVLSWNAEGHAALFDGDHVDEIAALIRSQRPDVVGLQEIHRSTWQARFRDQASELARLTGMNAWFGRSLSLGEGAYGNAVLTRGRIVRAAVHPLPTIGEPRTLLEAWIETEGGPVALFVTHLVTWGAINRATRREQIACIEAHLRGTPIPWVLMGDLNAAPDDPEIDELLRSGVVIEAAPRAATHRLTGQQLDYLLVDPGWKVQWARVLDDGPSDHRPLVAGLIRPSRESS